MSAHTNRTSNHHDHDDNAVRERLTKMIEHLSHVLPGQAPIKDFVHHNTLHGFQHLSFKDALKAVDDLAGTYAYMSGDEFREYYQQGRITAESLKAVINADMSLDAASLCLAPRDTHITKGKVIQSLMSHGIQAISAQNLDWRIAEQDVLTRFQPDVSMANQHRLAESFDTEADALNALWVACLDVMSLEHQTLHPETIAELPPELAENLFDQLDDEQPASSVTYEAIHKAMSKESDKLRLALWEEVGEKYSLGGLIKRLTGYDILDDYRPALMRHLASFLDQGVASWHNKQRDKGFFKAWKESALEDFVGRDSELPDWYDELLDLPDDPLQAMMVELDHLGLEEEKWAEYLERISLEIPGWSGMFLWLHDNPDYEASAVPVEMMDYLAVRLVLERLYAQRFTRQQWQLESSLYTLSWYFHRRHSEFYVRYHLFQGNLPEFLVSQANALARHDAEGAPDYEQWKPLANKILIWQQSKAKRYSAHEHAWVLFRLAQVLGICAQDVAALSEDELSRLFDVVAEHDSHQSGYLWLQAYELNYRDEFFNAVSNNHQRGNWSKRESRPDSQLFFCMDEREEGIRRHLEAINPAIETFGAAGFYSFPMRWLGLDDKKPVLLTPVVVDPVHEIHEKPIAEQQDLHKQHEKRHAQRELLEDSLSHEMRRNVLSSMLAMLLSTPATLAILVGKVFAPLKTGTLLRKARESFDIPIETDMNYKVEQANPDAMPTQPNLGFDNDEQAERVRAFLSNNGLTHNFSKIVAIFGHGATNENNPHRSAYGCGACSGKYGGPNARVFARVANRPEIREKLRELGIDIPDDTWFLGALHNTCSEEITWYDTALVPDNLQASFEEVKASIATAIIRSAHERCRKFASAPVMPSDELAVKHIAGRALDFSQARPELGHATNAAAIIGRRSVSQGVFFDRRVFLISYDPTQDDEEGHILEGLLLSAGPVGAGISLEYYFSKVSNNVLGSGSKITHNVTGFFGVMEGAGSDLRTGLPKQMIEIHEAMRLQVMVEASTEVIGKIYGRQPALQELIGNGWILVSSIDPNTGEITVFKPDEGFVPWDEEGEPLQEVKKAQQWYDGKMQPLKPVFIKQGAEHV